MRTGQNSGRSTVPKLGISRGVPLPRRRKRLIENARLRSKLSRNDSSQLQISNRERMAISPRIVLCLSSFEPQAPSFQTLIANPELEFHLTGCKTNHIQFSNRKFFTVFHCSFSGPGSSRPITHHCPPNRDTAIKISRNPNKRTAVQNSNRDKNGTFQSRLSPQDVRAPCSLPASSLQFPAPRPAPSL